MPIYEYECRACGERHEALQKFSEGPLRKCPACGKLKLKRLVSAAAFHLKGTGWYVTDFRDKDKKQPKEDKPEAATEAKPDGKEGKEAADGKDRKDTKKKEAKKEGKSKSGGASASASD